MTWGYKGLQRVTRGYRKLEGLTRGSRELNGVKGDYKGKTGLQRLHELEGVTRVKRG